MKIQFAFLLLSLLFLIVIFTGCVQSPEKLATPSPVTTNFPVPSNPPTETMQPTLTLSPASTNTIKPLSIPTVVPTLPTFTPTFISTLSVEDARQRLLDLLANNGGCQLPCLWGITPGKSSYLEAHSIMISLSGIAETVHPDSISPLYVDVEDNSHPNKRVVDRLNTKLGDDYGTDGIISSISFGALQEEVTFDANGNWTEKRPIFDSTTFGKRVAYYSLAHVLTEQGVPASVMIQFNGASLYPDYALGLDIALIYPDQGIWVNYKMPMQNRANAKVGCPNGSAQVDMELFPSGNRNSFYAQLDQTNWGVTKGAYKPLEEVTGMSVEKFYETFRNPTSDQCIQAPANLWPTPEFESPNN